MAVDDAVQSSSTETDDPENAPETGSAATDA